MSSWMENTDHGHMPKDSVENDVHFEASSCHSQTSGDSGGFSCEHAHITVKNSLGLVDN